MVNTVVLTAMPNPSVRTIVAAKPGCLPDRAERRTAGPARGRPADCARLPMDDWRWRVRLRQGLHPLCESARLAELLDGQATRVGIARTGGAKLLVPVIQMLRQFLDDLGFPGRTRRRACSSSPVTARSAKVTLSSEGSGMIDPRDEPHGLDEAFPRIPLAGQDAAPGRGQAVEAASPLSGLLDPSSLQPSALFQAIEKGIQGGDVELELPVRARLDQLADFVAVPRPRFEDREDDELGRPLLQFAVEDAASLAGIATYATGR